MKILIIEDEIIAYRKLKRLISEIDKNIEIVDILDTVEESIIFLKEKSSLVDLILMDIQLADGSSFDIFKKVDIQIPIIFTTAYSEFAVQAFKVNSVDYLLKPFDKDALAHALNKFQSIFSKAEQSHQLIEKMEIEKMIQQLQQKQLSYKERFIIKIGEHLKTIPTEDATCFYSKDKITFLRNEKGRNYVVDYTLEQLMTLLDPKKFYRINRKFFIHIRNIIDIYVYSGNRLRIKIMGFEEEEIIVSREKVQEFKRWLDA